MKKRCGLLLGCILLLLAGCSGVGELQDDGVYSEVEVSSLASVVEDEPVPDTEQEVEQEIPRFENTAVFEVDVEKGTMSAELSYTRDERMGTSFLLNRGFTVTRLVCDGEAIDPDEIHQLLNISNNYTVSQYILPQFEDSLRIQYTGAFDPNNRMTTYARESISEAFTMLRSETFCYPLFAEDWDSTLRILNQEEPLRTEITIRVPEGYTAVTPFPLLEQGSGNGLASFVFEGDLFRFNCAIAQYDHVEMPTGAYYFLPGADLEPATARISSVMGQAHEFLSERFGEVEIPPAMRYIVIPDGYGAYALPGQAVFIEEETFDTDYDMHYLIHEYIHLGWNPRTEDQLVRRSRFFDEGFTCYFEIRTMGHLWGEEIYTSEMEKRVQALRDRYGQNSDYLVPIADYGRYEYGDLSYRIGPVFFDELAKLVGTDVLDGATRSFLEKYRDTPVDFEIFCAEYMELCGNEDLEQFLEEWIYSTEGIRKTLSIS